MPSASTIAASTASRLSASSASDSDSIDELLLCLAGELEVTLRVDPLGRQPACGAVPHLVGLRVDELVRDLDLRSGHDGVDRRLAELALDRAFLGLA